ncbi:hypothetical protein ACFC08_28625 [Streptomyces sp. NPDC056112]|uniref:hypothetical protein n=1 Tax=Streptomyces sp. NPDC056112 TaxID=3345715 RepID=UPI0035DC42DA
MTDRPAPADEPRVAAERFQRLLDRWDPESLIELLLTNNEQRAAQLRKACESLRAATEDMASAHQRLAVLVAARQINAPTP